jgi:hypothetical protein
MGAEFYNSPKWEISAREIKEINGLRCRLNELYSMLTFQTFGDPFIYVSLETIKKIKDIQERINRKVKKLDKEELSAFDALVLKDVKRNADIIKISYDYLDNSKSNMRIGSFISRTFGDSSYSELLKSITPDEFPHKQLHKNSELFHAMNHRKIDGAQIFGSHETPFILELRNRFLNELNKTKSLIDKFYIEKEVVKKVPKYNFQFAPPAYPFSFWEGQHLLASIDSDRVFCFKPEGEQDYVFFSGFMNLIGIHELGHGYHEMMSEQTMPRGLNPDYTNFLPIVHGPCSEGAALAVEDFALEWMQGNMQRLGLSKKYIEKCTSVVDCYVAKKLPQIVHNLLEQKEIEGIHNQNLPHSLSLQSHKHLASLSGVKRYLSDYYLLNDEEINNSLFQLPYFFGQKRARNLVRKMQEKGVDDGLIMQALFTGCWSSPEAQEKFILDLYLPKVLGKNYSAK